MTLIPLMLLKSYSDYMTVECIVLIKYEENYYITLYRFEYHLQAHESNRDKDTFAFIPNKFLLNLVILVVFAYCAYEQIFYWQILLCTKRFQTLKFVNVQFLLV